MKALPQSRRCSHFPSFPLSNPIPTYALCQVTSVNLIKKKKKEETLGHFTFRALNKKYFSLRAPANPCPRKTPEIKAEPGRYPVGGPVGGGGAPVLTVEMFLSQRTDFISS